MPQALFNLVGAAEVPFLGHDKGRMNSSERGASGSGTYHGHDLAEVTHGLQVSFLIFIAVRNNNLGTRLGYHASTIRL